MPGPLNPQHHHAYQEARRGIVSYFTIVPNLPAAGRRALKAVETMIEAPPVSAARC